MDYTRFLFHLEEIKQKLQTDGITVKEAQEIIDRNIRESQKAVSMKTKAKGINNKIIAARVGP